MRSGSCRYEECCFDEMGIRTHRLGGIRTSQMRLAQKKSQVRQYALVLASQ